jgi:hypothetical protein
MIDQKQPESVEYLKGSMITNDASSTRAIESIIVMAKAAFSKKKTLFTSKLDETRRVLHLEHSFIWC